MGAAIQVKDISIYYETLQALFEVNMDIIFGKLTLLVGPNGAGKSTLLASISGLLYDRIQRRHLHDERIGLSGAIYYNKEDITHLPPHKRVERGIFHCIEGRGLFPEMSVLDNLMAPTFPSKNREGIKADMERVFSFFPELRRLQKKETGFLSGGEQQLVVLGRALMARPAFLLIDEPMAGLALNIQERIKKIISQFLDEKKMGILITEQNSRILLELSEKVYVLGRGSIVFEGTAEEAAKDPYICSTYFA